MMSIGWLWGRELGRGQVNATGCRKHAQFLQKEVSPKVHVLGRGNVLSFRLFGWFLGLGAYVQRVLMNPHFFLYGDGAIEIYGLHPQVAHSSVGKTDE